MNVGFKIAALNTGLNQSIGSLGGRVESILARLRAHQPLLGAQQDQQITLDDGDLLQRHTSTPETDVPPTPAHTLFKDY